MRRRNVGDELLSVVPREFVVGEKRNSDRRLGLLRMRELPRLRDYEWCGGGGGGGVAAVGGSSRKPLETEGRYARRKSAGCRRGGRVGYGRGGQMCVAMGGLLGFR